jgi:hypothetical protein
MVEKRKEIGMRLPCEDLCQREFNLNMAVERSTDQAINVSTITAYYSQYVKGAGVISPSRVGYDINFS